MDHKKSHIKPNTTTESLLRREIGRITDKFEQAHQRLHRSRTIEDYADAEEERRAIAGKFWAAGRELAHLALLLLRHAQQYEPQATCLWLTEALRPELVPITEAQASLEQRVAALERKVRS